MDVVNLANWTLVDDILVSTSKEENNYTLSWATSRLYNMMLIVGCGKEHCARIFAYQNNKWIPTDTLKTSDNVLDVAWAPHIGKSYQVIAVSSRDGKVKLFKYFEEGKTKKFKVEVMDELDHGAACWRLEWNVTGTVLASSGDDGRVLLWKLALNNQFKLVHRVFADDEHVSR